MNFPYVGLIKLISSYLMRIEHTDKLFTEAALETYTANERGGIEPAVLDQ